MPKMQSFNSNSENYADFWKILGFDLQVALYYNLTDFSRTQEEIILPRHYNSVLLLLEIFFTKVYVF